MSKKIHEHEHKICNFVNDWIFEDPGMMNWEKREELKKLIDAWHLLYDFEDGWCLHCAATDENLNEDHYCPECVEILGQ